MYTPVDVPRFARMISTFSVGLTSVVNPMVYWVRSKTFHDALRGIFGKKDLALQDSGRINASDWNSLDPSGLASRNSSSVNRKRASTLNFEDTNL